MRQRNRQDHDLEQWLRLRKVDPSRDMVGGRRYSPADIEALEEEKVPWLKAKRRRG
jgi:hypothetical protein